MPLIIKIKMGLNGITYCTSEQADIVHFVRVMSHHFASVTSHHASKCFTFYLTLLVAKIHTGFRSGKPVVYRLVTFSTKFQYEFPP